MVHTICRQLLTAKAWVQSQSHTCENCGRWRGTGTRYSASTPVLSCHLLFRQCYIPYPFMCHPGMDNGPIRVCCSSKKSKPSIKTNVRFKGLARYHSRVGYRLDNPGFESLQGQGIFFSPKCPDMLWNPPSLLLNRYRWSFPRRGW
jgi:hypothetical protein